MLKRPATFVRLTLADFLPRYKGTGWNDLDQPGAVRFTYSGRGAIYQYLAALRRSGRLGPRRNTVLLPAFHCPTVVDPVLHAGFECRFYGIDEKLEIDVPDFLGKLDRGVAAALFIRYFGFGRLDPALQVACRTAGARVIEDCSHSFLNADPLRLAFSGADATTYSLYKLVPGKIGGAAVLHGEAADDEWPRLAAPGWRERRAWWSRALQDVRSRRAPSSAVAGPVVRKSAEEAYPYVEQESEWRLPTASRWILLSCDLAGLVEARRSNYEILARRIRPGSAMTCLRPILDADTCPWAFPVLLKRRQELDYRLWSLGVPLFTFGEVLHPVLFRNHPSDQKMLDRARLLSEELLAFSIHQGLSGPEMQESVATINQFMTTA